VIYYKNNGAIMIPKYDNQNIFAKIIRKEIPAEIIYENDMACAFYDIAPQAPVHILVIPKGEYVSYEDFYLNASSLEIQQFHACINQVITDKNIGQTQGSNGFRVISNIGFDGGQEVLHFHVHLLAGCPLGKLVSL
jgi:diadenosine tetraphosphate (Ap4A) HIT family hydrolase